MVKLAQVLLRLVLEGSAAGAGTIGGGLPMAQRDKNADKKNMP
jgi:hypothetical protein